MSGVLFDLDDTLLDYSGARDAAVVEWAAGIGVTLQGPALIDAWRALEDHHFSRYTAGELSLADQRRARVRGLPGLESLTDEEADAHFAEFLVRAERHWRPLPGATEAVARVAARLPVGILTNGAQEIQQRKLHLLGLAHLPLFASSRTGTPKPQPAAFLDACAALASEPGRTLMVGDNAAVDVRGALDAGLAAVWVSPVPSPAPLGAARISSVAELSPAAHWTGGSESDEPSARAAAAQSGLISASLPQSGHVDPA